MELEKLAQEVKSVVSQLDTLGRVGEKYAADSAGEDGQKAAAVIAYGLYDTLCKEAAVREVSVPELSAQLAQAVGQEVTPETAMKLAAAAVVDEFLMSKEASADNAEHLQKMRIYGREFYASMLNEVL